MSEYVEVGGLPAEADLLATSLFGWNRADRERSRSSPGGTRQGRGRETNKGVSANFADQFDAVSVRDETIDT
jgi:hypothetical protein